MCRTQSCPWVGLTRGLGWVGLGREWVENLCFQWVGSGHGSQMADLRKIHVVYICNFVSSIDWEIRFLKTCSNASDTVGVCIVTVCMH